MNLTNVLQAVGNDLKGFYTRLAADVQKARQAWLIISSAQTRSVLLRLGSDAIKLVKDAGEAAGGKGLSLALDQAVIADICQIVKDAEAGDAVIVNDLKVLGIIQ